MTTFITFDRQYKQNGTVDSVCILCQRTVATGQSIIDLVPSEIVHTCATTQIRSHDYQEMHHA